MCKNSEAIRSVPCPQGTVGKKSLATVLLSTGVCKVPLFVFGAGLAAWKKFHAQPLKECFFGRQSTRHRHIGVDKDIKRPISCCTWVDVRRCLALTPGPSLWQILKTSFGASRVSQAPSASSHNSTSLRHACNYSPHEGRQLVRALPRLMGS